MAFVKRSVVIFFVLGVVLMLPVGYGRGQDSAVPIEGLVVDLWPDYDRPSLLVLLTGVLAPETVLPADVSFYLPPNADLNAVARISSDNVMIDDIDYTMTPAADGRQLLTLTTPDLRFRVEYYEPYLADSDQRRFTFTWLADVPTNQLQVTVQQPAVAADLSTLPAATVVVRGGDGLQYHELPAVTVPAGEVLALQGSYTMTGPQLTATVVASGIPAVSDPPAGAAANWPLVIASIGAGLLLLALFWYAMGNRPGRKVRPRPRRPQARTLNDLENRSTVPARFCHQCGHAAQPDDRFCRNCGTALKGRR